MKELKCTKVYIDQEDNLRVLFTVTFKDINDNEGKFDSGWGLTKNKELFIFKDMTSNVLLAVAKDDTMAVIDSLLEKKQYIAVIDYKPVTSELEPGYGTRFVGVREEIKQMDAGSIKALEKMKNYIENEV